MKEDILDHLRVATPCGVGWDKMSGSDRKRFCTQCSLHVYNISELTRAEVATLFATSPGRVCGQLYRRADGTVITRDCPVGLRDLRRRVTRKAGAALAAVIGLATAVASQQRLPLDLPFKRPASYPMSLEVERKVSSGERALIGVITDATGAAIPGASLTLTDEVLKHKFKVVTTDAGEFRFTGLGNNHYTLEVKRQGFKRAKLAHLYIFEDETVRLEMVLFQNGVTGTIGILVGESSYESSNGTTIIRGEMLKRFLLP